MADRMDELLGAVQRVEQAIKGQLFPIPPGSTPAYKNSSGQPASVVLDSSGNVPTTGGGGGGSTTTVVQANAGTNLNTSLLALETGGNLAAAAASLSVLDDWDETNRAAVNVIPGQVGVAAGAGATDALTQRVVLATDDVLYAAPSNATTTALQASLIIKASAGRLFQLSGYNANTAAVYIQLHNTATVPADTQVPVQSIVVPAASNFSIDYGLRGRQFSGGIVMVTSTSQAVKVLGAANTFADAQYA